MFESDPEPEGDPSVQMYWSDNTCRAPLGGGRPIGIVGRRPRGSQLSDWELVIFCHSVSISAWTTCSVGTDQVLGLFGPGAHPGLHVQTVRPAWLGRPVRPVRVVLPCSD